MFNGLASNYSRPAVPKTEDTENLVMTWSDDWLANVDCNGDGKLDRGLDATFERTRPVTQARETQALLKQCVRVGAHLLSR